MARLTFRQGIVRHGQSPGQSFFLQQNGQFVDLLVSPDTTIVAFSDGTKDYMFSEAVTAIKAWGPFTILGQDYWLYWDINRITGIRTYGHTTFTPIYATTAPISPVAGQMWFDTSAMKMYEYSGSSWVHVLRTFACKYNNNQFFSPVDGVSLETNFTGTQAGSAGNVTRNVGSLAFDATGAPIINQTGQFFTTEDVFTTGVPTGASLKVNDILIRGQAQENIAPYQVVVFSDFNKIQLAAPFDFLEKVYAISEESIPTNAIGNVMVEGVVYNENWDFTDAINFPNMSGKINDPIYITATGELTTNLSLSIPGAVPMGAIIGQQSVLFRPGIYGYGTGNASVGDHGSLTGLADDDHLQYFNTTRGDARYYPRTIADVTFAQVAHTHVKADITNFAHSHIEADISDLDKYTQTEVDTMLNAKVSVIGDTMTGALILPSDPVNPLEAATKQYVDAIAAGLDAKDSVAVTTTADIGGVYSATGGTGGTGQFTNIDITNLDGAKDVAYDFLLTTRILVKDQTDAKQNGIYIITDQANPLLATLERAPDQDGTPAAEVTPGNFTFIAGGATHAGTGWVVLAGTASGPNDTIVLNTDDMNWSQVSSATAYTAGNNIVISGANVISTKDVIDGGTIDALTWNGHSVVTQGSPLPANDNVLLYNSISGDWETGFPSFISGAFTGEVRVNAVDGSINVSSPDTLLIESGLNTNINSSGAVNMSSVGNTTLTAGTSSILLNNTTDITLTSDNVIVNPTAGVGSIVLKSGAYNSVLSAGANTTNTQFSLPPNNGTLGQVLSTNGYGTTSWIDSATGGGSAFCIRDTDNDTYVEVGFGASPTCTDSGSNNIRIQAGVQPSAGVGGEVVIQSGSGNAAASGRVRIEAAPGGYGATSGGNVEIVGGYGTAVPAGNVNITAGTGTGIGSIGGDINITAGDGYGYANNTSGNITIAAGGITNPVDITKNSGDVHIQTIGSYAGYSDPGNFTAGDIYLEPGISIAGSYGAANGGNIVIRSNGLNAYGNGWPQPILKFTASYNANAGYVGLEAPFNAYGTTGNGLRLVLPYSPGAAGQFLKINTVTENTDYTKLDLSWGTPIDTNSRSYDLHAEGVGVLSDGQEILRFVMVRSFTLKASGHGAWAFTAPPLGSPAVNAVFEVIRLVPNALGSSFEFPLGTITFEATTNPESGAIFSGFTDTVLSPTASMDMIVIRCVTAAGIGDVTITLNCDEL